MIPLSHNVIKLLGLGDASALNCVVSITTLAKALADIKDFSSIRCLLLQSATNHAPKAAIVLRDLHKVRENDSVVRDMLTSGHLAKYLIRYAVLVETNNYRIIGASNSVCDDVSTKEREEYFLAGNSLSTFHSQEEILRLASIWHSEADSIRRSERPGSAL